MGIYKDFLIFFDNLDTLKAERRDFEELQFQFLPLYYGIVLPRVQILRIPRTSNFFITDYAVFFLFFFLHLLIGIIVVRLTEEGAVFIPPLVIGFRELDLSNGVAGPWDPRLMILRSFKDFNIIPLHFLEMVDVVSEVVNIHLTGRILIELLD